MKIIIGSDHAGYEAKEMIKSFLLDKGYTFEDRGVDSNTATDYPLIAQDVSNRVLETKGVGILICGSGTGMQIAANKVKGIRAAFVYDEYSAKMARNDNDANIMTLRSREFDYSIYERLIDVFLTTNFSQEKRHQQRINELE